VAWLQRPRECHQVLSQPSGEGEGRVEAVKTHAGKLKAVARYLVDMLHQVEAWQRRRAPIVVIGMRAARAAAAAAAAAAVAAAAAGGDAVGGV